MARINLLPWRAERRVQRQREFYVMLGAAAIAGLLLSFLLWFHYDRQVSGQTARNDFLKDEIAKVQAQNKEIEKLDEQKRRLLARKDVIEKLQANRSQMVHLFDSLVRTIPDGVMLANIKQEGEVLTLLDDGDPQATARLDRVDEAALDPVDLRVRDDGCDELPRHDDVVNARDEGERHEGTVSIGVSTIGLRKTASGLPRQEQRMREGGADEVE